MCKDPKLRKYYFLWLVYILGTQIMSIKRLKNFGYGKSENAWTKRTESFAVRS